eukprot:186865-Chlamydomonas_euryale.AAC.1
MARAALTAAALCAAVAASRETPLGRWPALAWGSYCAALEAQPLLTKTVTALVGCFLGDLLAQVLCSRAASRPVGGGGGGGGFSYDVGRMARLMAYTLLTSPLLAMWCVMAAGAGRAADCCWQCDVPLAAGGRGLLLAM